MTHSQHRRTMPQVTPRRVGHKGKYVESFDKMLNRFKRACNKAGIVAECKKRQFYVKPNETRNQIKMKIKRKQKLAKFKAANSGYRRGTGKF